MWRTVRDWAATGGGIVLAMVIEVAGPVIFVGSMLFLLAAGVVAMVRRLAGIAPRRA